MMPARAALGIRFPAPLCYVCGFKVTSDGQALAFPAPELLRRLGRPSTLLRSCASARGFPDSSTNSIRAGDGTGGDDRKCFLEERLIDARGCSIQHAKAQPDCPQRIVSITTPPSRGRSPNCSGLHRVLGRRDAVRHDLLGVTLSVMIFLTSFSLEAVSLAL